MKGKVTTVSGELETSELGWTLTHEHLHVDTTLPFMKTPWYESRNPDSGFTLDNIGWIRQNPDLANFKEEGGGTIVENSSWGLLRNVSFVKKVSAQTKVNLVVGTGFYVDAAQDANILSHSQEKLEKVITEELTIGCLDDSTVKCGFIGEVGSSWPLTDFERRSIKASGAVEETLGSPVMIHPGRNPKSPEEVVRHYSEAGGTPGKLVVAHLDRTIFDFGELLEFAELGTFLEYDLFGIETSRYQPNPEVFMPSDGQRIDTIKHLIEHGFEDKILISHDIHTKHRLEKFGGHGYCHIFRNVVPMMLRRGIPQPCIDKMLITNPAQWLTFAK